MKNRTKIKKLVKQAMARATMRGDSPRCLSLFSGMGGLDDGVIDSGFDVAVASDIWEEALRLVTLNHKGTKTVCGDIRTKKTQDEIVAAVGSEGVGLITAGIPCQPFSIAGARDPDKDEDAKLFVKTFDLIYRLFPLAFLFENVEGFFSSTLEGTSVMYLVAEMAARHGYALHYRLLCAADFSVPQKRYRVVMIGVRHDVAVNWPKATHDQKGKDGLPVWRTAGEAIGDLVGAPLDKEFGHWHGPTTKRMLEIIACTPPGAKAVTAGRNLYRLAEDEAANTVVAHISNRLIHYLDSEARQITGREAMRLQGFRDSYSVSGCSQSDIVTATGNAVPPPLAKVLGGTLLDIVRQVRSGNARELTEKDLERHLANLVLPSGLTISGERARASAVRAINDAEGRINSSALDQGRAILGFMQAVSPNGEKAEDEVYELLAEGDDCKHGKSQLRNLAHYAKLHDTLERTYGKAPAVGLTHYVVVDVAADRLPVEEKYLLLKKAEEKGLSVAKLAGLVEPKAGRVKAVDQNARIVKVADAAAAGLGRAVDALAKKGEAVSQEAKSACQRLVDFVTGRVLGQDGKAA